MFDVSAVVLSTALLLALVLNLALKPSFSAKLSTTCMVVSLVGGIVFYGTGFAHVTGSILLTMVRTTLAVIRMFVGMNEVGVVENTPLLRYPVCLALFWIIHLLAFYSMASAAMFTLGAEALRHFRMLLSRRGDLTLIYGVNDNSIAVGKECVKRRGSAVVFVTEGVSPNVVADLNNLGMSVLSGTEAVSSDKKVLKKLRVSSRKLAVYAMDEAEDKNLFYSLRMKDTLEELGVPPENTQLTLPGEEEIITSMLQVSPEKYGFGFVNVYDIADLAARAMVRICPPWDFIRYGPDGSAQEDFECVVVGFGRFGQSALRRLIMNGQFSGAQFHAAVFSPLFESESGYFFTDCPELTKEYDIKGYSADARSSVFYRYISSRLSSLKLIAICTGSDDRDREISDNLMLFLKRHQSENICVVRCGRSGARYQETVGSPILYHGIFTLSMLSAENADREAILLNSIYDSSDRSPWEKWVACDSFSKMSSRAFTDFIPAYLKMSGSTREAVAAGDWHPDEAMQTVLGKTEHKRWVAFHYAMGYTAMTPEEFDSNAKLYAQCKAEGRPCPVRISKNTLARTHACLIPWDELDALSRRESAITGRNVNYKQTDINNVLSLPLLLKSSEGGGQG